jgi:hypothetical protein
MSKFLLNLLLQISKALVYLKIKFYSEKNFPVNFGPAAAHFFSFQPAIFLPPSPLGLGLSAGPAHPHGPTGHLLLPLAPEPSAHGATGRPRVAPTVDPDASTGRKKWPHQSPFIPPLIGTISPSSITGNRRLQLGPLKLLQHRPLKALGLPRLASTI